MKGRKSKANLARRIAAFENNGVAPGPRNGDKWYRTMLGKVVMYHKPGSNKK